MIWWRPPVKYRAWYETRLCEKYGCQGLATLLWGRHLVPLPIDIPANDRDSLNW
jgi:hypothetical protein